MPQDDPTIVEDIGTQSSTQGIVPSVKNAWDNLKSPIAFLAIGFTIGFFVKRRNKV
jgi:hypothetical protein